MDRIITAIGVLVFLFFGLGGPSWGEEADITELRRLLSSRGGLQNLGPEQKRIHDDATARPAKYLPMIEELIDEHFAKERYICLGSVAYLLEGMDSPDARRLNLTIHRKAMELYLQSVKRMNSTFCLVAVGLHEPRHPDRDLILHAVKSLVHVDAQLRKLIFDCLERNFLDDAVVMDTIARMVADPREALSNDGELKALLERRKDKPASGGGQPKK